MFNGEVVIYADGGCQRNGQPGARAYGTFLVQAMRDGAVLKSTPSGWLDYPMHMTNNAAEFQVMIDALDFLIHAADGERIYYPVRVFGDSELVINGINGTYSINADHLIPLLREIQQRLGQFDDIQFRHVRRHVIVEKLGH